MCVNLYVPDFPWLICSYSIRLSFECYNDIQQRSRATIFLAFFYMKVFQDKE